MMKLKKITVMLLCTVLLMGGCMREATDEKPESERTPTQETDAPQSESTAPETEETPETKESLPPETEAPETEPESEEPETEIPEPEVIETSAPGENISVSLPDRGDGIVFAIDLDRSQVEITVGLSDMPWVTMHPTAAQDKSEIWATSDPNIATVDAYGRILGISPGTCTVTVAAGARPELTAEIPVTVHAPNYASEVTYIEGILVANKTYGLPPSYDPGVDPDAKAALDELIAAAAEDDINLWLKSGYRAFETQKMLYNTYVSREGKLEADRYSARPGHSEHQTGLAFDLNSLEQNFGETKEGIWLAEHCVEYGFIIRYPADKEEITGYMYEPWHIRYLGKETARLVSESGKCLEEYLGIISQYEY